MRVGMWELKNQVTESIHNARENRAEYVVTYVTAAQPACSARTTARAVSV